MGAPRRISYMLGTAPIVPSPVEPWVGKRTSGFQQGLVGVNWGNPSSASLAFLWSASEPTRELKSGLLAQTNNTSRITSRLGKAVRCLPTQTNVEWNKQFIITSDGAGTGDFTMLVIANPVAGATGTNEHMFSQKNDPGGAPLAQAGLWANANLLGNYISGSVALFLNNGTTGGVSAAAMADGRWHVYIGTRRGSAMSLYRDGVWAATNSSSVLGITQASPERFTAIGSRGNGTTNGYAGDTIMAASWNRALNEVEIASISANPWQLFASGNQQIWVPAS